MNMLELAAAADAAEVDLAPCAETRESVRRELREVEADLARVYGIEHAPRMELLRRSYEGSLPETALVHRWYSLYASYQEWLSEAAEAPPERPTRKPRKPARGAARAASPLFV
jgi:hypothetical protein